ncbi:receptor-like serine/threonine-protein kinase SD1-7 isoform X2 [Magnolia sinica]|uniref:receptor-like serine/threonine-protein kinase SD1-7 isoform X2 n=1 Tax=Magnolia sinica TaxID=86752 RepID=UPI002659FCAD|nr:receptor-like serine/threonine-protein kinase SD1-7 isoform X2 [Magnolia sinica]
MECNGYMSPEYAMDALFSVKSDVFIVGVLLLEIINGKRNNNCFKEDPSQNLIRYRDNSELAETDGLEGYKHCHTTDKLFNRKFERGTRTNGKRFHVPNPTEILVGFF